MINFFSNQTLSTRCEQCWRVGSRIVKVGLKLLILLFGVMLLIDLATSYLVRERIYHDINQLPKRDYAVVLGTAKFYPSGSPNLYYRYRLDAAKKVFDHQKADYFLLSGDNKTVYYNEPKMMTEDLHKRGIPLEVLKQDNAGFSTLESVLRAERVFQLKSFTVISQSFHCERALLIARFYDIDAICFTAEYPQAHYRVRIREFFARSAMMIQLLFGEAGLKLAKWVKDTD